MLSSFSICSLKPFTSCCIGSAGHRTTTTTTSPNLPTTSSSSPSPEFSFPVHAPSLIRSQSFPASFAGGRWGSLGDSPVHTIPAGLQDTEWGSPTSLDGLLGTAFICHEALQQTHTRALHAAGRSCTASNENIVVYIIPIEDLTSSNQFDFNSNTIIRQKTENHSSQRIPL